jgi:hypothetical protein
MKFGCSLLSSSKNKEVGLTGSIHFKSAYCHLIITLLTPSSTILPDLLQVNILSPPAAGISRHIQNHVEQTRARPTLLNPDRTTAVNNHLIVN